MIDVILPVVIHEPEILRLTESAIESIRNTKDDLNLIIIDNGSSLGGGFLREQADLYLREKVNVGYPKAVNHGIQLSRGEFICIANNDIRVSHNVFQIARTIFKNEAEKIGSVHYRMIGYEEPMALDTGIWVTGKERWCSSSFFVMKRRAVDLYDERYGLGGFDDYDFWHRFRHINGWRTAYTNQACYQHLDSSTQNRRDPQERSQSDVRNREYFKEKWGEYPDELFRSLHPQQWQLPWKPFP